MVDWSQPNAVIAGEVGRTVQRVSIVRRDLGQRRAPGYKRVPPEVWRRADWTLRDGELARRLGVTQAAVWYTRRVLGKPKVPPLKHTARTLALWAFIEAHRPVLAGQRLDLIGKIVNARHTRASPRVVIKALNTLGVPFQRHGWPYPYLLLDWHLPDEVLADIWGLPPSGIAASRWFEGLGKAPWPAGSRRRRQRGPYAIRRQKKLRAAYRHRLARRDWLGLAQLLRGPAARSRWRGTQR
jgi:hypothetical protein